MNGARFLNEEYIIKQEIDTLLTIQNYSLSFKIAIASLNHPENPYKYIEQVLPSKISVLDEKEN